MNLTELRKALAAIGVPSPLVALGRHADLARCVERSDEGQWEVFSYKRGNKNSLACLNTESEACYQLLGRLAYSQLLAGAIGVR
ncbi:hypothetical protein [Mycolicibacterium neoaurum]|uniref:hypothetical protein n=1 Tax=Mycolicibacterium neoaurum TaxID=1795 RepID=UPI0010FE5008|nr:hypothetical protein [Mycolicibacterium neoaurum]